MPNGIDDLKLEGFHSPLVQKPYRKSNRGGGLAFYVNKRVCSEENISVVSVMNAPEPIEVAGEFQILRVDIDINNRPGKHSQFFVNCYRSPSGNLDTFFEKLSVLCSPRNDG